MNMKTQDFDYEDYRDIRHIFIKEELDEEDLKEGLVPEIYDICICFTPHAFYRMESDESREVGWEEIKDIFLNVEDTLLSARDGEEFDLFSREMDVKIPCVARFHDGKLNLIVKTVIRILLSNGSFKTLNKTKKRKYIIAREK